MPARRLERGDNWGGILGAESGPPSWQGGNPNRHMPEARKEGVPTEAKCFPSERR